MTDEDYFSGQGFLAERNNEVQQRKNRTRVFDHDGVSSQRRYAGIIMRAWGMENGEIRELSACHD